MATANYDLDLSGEWLFHDGDFAYRTDLVGGDYHATSKTHGGLGHLQDFYEENNWKTVRVPHDWLTDLPVDKTASATHGCKPRGVAWYRKEIFLNDEKIERVNLIFDGVLGQTSVFVNGVLAVRNFSGYNRFSCEIGDYLLAGEKNEIVVFVDARRWEGWWYEGAGIYRSARLEFRQNLRFNKDEFFVRTQEKDGLWRVVADWSVLGDGEKKIRAQLFDFDGKAIDLKRVQTVKTNGKIEFSVQNPRLWSPENPTLYRLKFELLQDGVIIDELNVSVGFRKIEWKSGAGMFLNCEPYRVKGICCHQDHGGLGAAVPKEIEEYRVRKLKELGANAYRCAHHAPSESLLDLCDKLGLLVMVETRRFSVSEDGIKELSSLVRLARNHPCVFLYCLYNEEPWQGEIRGKRIAEKMRKIILEIDETRAVTGAQNADATVDGNASDCLDVVGLNYNLSRYEEVHFRQKEKAILGTENSPTFATRGCKTSDKNSQVFADDGYEYPKDFAEPLNETMRTVEKYPFVAGCFVWCGFDHRGEPNPYGYPSVSSHWGYLDNCGFEKNISYWLKAYYTDEPFVKLTEGRALDGKERIIRAFTNCESAKLYANGKDLGERKVENRRVEWVVPFEVSALKIVATKGELRAYDEFRVAGEFKSLKIEKLDKFQDESKLAIYNFTAVDESGEVVESENGLLVAEVFDGEILSVANGNPNFHGEDKGKSVPLFHGRAQVIVRRGEREIKFYYKGKEALK